MRVKVYARFVPLCEHTCSHMYACAHMCEGAHTYTDKCACVHAEEKAGHPSVLLILHLIPLRWAPFLNLGQQALVILLSQSPTELGFQKHLWSCWEFSVSSGNSNSGPCVYVANTLTHQPSSQSPCTCFFGLNCALQHRCSHCAHSTDEKMEAAVGEQEAHAMLWSAVQISSLACLFLSFGAFLLTARLNG